jgi:hypothetical protein
MTSASAVYRLDRANAVAWIGLAAIAVYFAVLAHAVGAWPYDEWMVLILAPALLAVGAVIVTAVTRDDEQPLTVLIVVALAVKLAASFVRYYVTLSLYGSGDAIAYDRAGTDIAASFHRGELALTELLTMRQGTGFIDDLTGLLYALTGPSRLGGFLTYSFVGFWGLFLFHRAARIGLPEGSQRRYAILVFFLPSLVFWPSSIGKEAVMLLSLGLCAYASARILERRRGGWLGLVAGAGLGFMVRPHVPVVVLAALAVAVAFRRRRGRPSVLGPVGRVVAIVALMAAMAFTLGRAVDRLLPSSEATSTTEAVDELLDRAESGTAGGGSQIDRPTPNTPLDYPAAVISVLFRPTILEADSAGNIAAALETTVVLALFVLSWKRLRNVPATAWRRPYVLFCLVYTGIFAFAWSSFANLGALARQRVQVWPFVLVLLAVPVVISSSDRPATTRPGRVVTRR